jgi:hypothetical protein
MYLGVFVVESLVVIGGTIQSDRDAVGHQALPAAGAKSVRLIGTVRLCVQARLLCKPYGLGASMSNRRADVA